MSSKLKVAGSNPAGVTTLNTQLSTFKDLGTKLANPKPRLANVCSPLFSFERLSRKAGLVYRLRVPLDLTQGRMTAYGGDLVCRASRFSETSARGLAQSVRRAPFRQPRLYAAITKPVAKSGRSEWLAKFGY